MTSPTHSAGHDAHHDTVAEPDHPKNGLIAILVVGVTLSVVAVVVAVNELFTAVVEREISTKLLEPQGTQLRELRAEEQAKLNRYQWVDKTKGVLRIPLDRAIDLTITEYRSKPFTSAAPTTTATPEGPKPEDVAQPQGADQKAPEKAPEKGQNQHPGDAHSGTPGTKGQ